MLRKEIFSEDVVNVFVSDLNNFKLELPKLLDLLSHREKLKASKFVFDHLKTRYIISHGLLRILFGKYLSLHPAEIDFVLNEFQKPFCKNEPALLFNISHSKDYACFAFSYQHKVGVDIEFIDRTFEVSDILPLIATPKEIKDFNDLHKRDRLFFFYKMWTLKEAFLKALGIGLSYNLSLIESTIIPKNTFKILKTSSILETEIENFWTFAPIKFVPQYIGAIAIERKDIKINFTLLNSILI